VQNTRPVDLVTGGTGLIGANLVRLLQRERRSVRLLVRKDSKISLFDDRSNLQFVVGDITDLDSITAASVGVENVYHLAAKVKITRRMTEGIWRTNVIGTENVIRAAQVNRVNRLIYCSTVDALGLPEGPEAATEQTPWNWDRLGVENAYARSKYEAHQRVLAAARQGLDAVLVCPAFVFGEYDSHPSSGRLIQAIAQRRLPGYPSGGNNFVDVRDVTQGMLSAAELGRAGEAYILGGSNLTYREIFSIIAAIVHVPSPRFPLPYPIAMMAGWFGELYERISGRDAGINLAAVQVSYLRHYYDSSKAIRQLGMPQSPIEAAIERAAAWLREQNMLSP
jgi:dihydroflavonol-4-reductase